MYEYGCTLHLTQKQEDAYQRLCAKMYQCFCKKIERQLQKENLYFNDSEIREWLQKLSLRPPVCLLEIYPNKLRAQREIIDEALREVLERLEKQEKKIFVYHVGISTKRTSVEYMINCPE